MAEKNGNGWKGWALAAMTTLIIGFIIGGGVTGFVGYTKDTALATEIKELEETHEKDTKEAKEIRNADYNVLMEMSNALIEVRTNQKTLITLLEEVREEQRRSLRREAR